MDTYYCCRVSSLPDVAGGGGGGGGGTGVQSTSQDIPALDVLWVESKTKKAALRVCLFLFFFCI